MKDLFTKESMKKVESTGYALKLHQNFLGNNYYTMLLLLY
jgi:hypothetical protein